MLRDIFGIRGGGVSNICMRGLNVSDSTGLPSSSLESRNVSGVVILLLKGRFEKWV